MTKKINKLEKGFFKAMIRVGALIVGIMTIMHLIGFAFFYIFAFALFSTILLFFVIKPYYWNYFSKMEMEDALYGEEN